jgi:hypothetical protein
MTLSFMIKKKYLLEKVVEQEETGTFHERRAYTKFWRARIGSVSRWTLKSSLKSGGLFADAVFVCGRYAYYANILNITLEETPPGIEEVVPGDLCYNIECEFYSGELEGLSMFLS